MICDRIHKFREPGGFSVQHFPSESFSVLELSLEWDSDFGLKWGPWFFEIVFAFMIAAEVCGIAWCWYG